jgi:hypothetical protein
MTQKDDLNRGTYLSLKHNKIEDSIKNGRWAYLVWLERQAGSHCSLNPTLDLIPIEPFIGKP